MKGIKLTQRIIALFCSLAMAFSFAGCKEENRENTLYITVSQLGFGTDWIYEMEKEFESIYNVEVKINPTVIAKDLLTQLESGYQLDDLCFFAGVDKVWEVMLAGKFMEIDDIWSATVEGETTSVSEKTLPEWVEAYNVNGHYYSLPFISEIGGMGYNRTTLDTLLGEGNWSLPRTTEELTALSERVKNAGGYAFTWSNKENSCYWGIATDTWAAQYDGAENFNRSSFAEIYDEESGEWIIDQTGEMLNREGYLKAYEAAYVYINQSYGYSHQYCTSMDFMQSQYAFAGGGYANDKKLVAFTPTGSWLYEETKQDFEEKLQEIGFMNTPVISSLSEKLSYYADGDTAFSALSSDKKSSYDAALSAIIAYVDGDTTEKPTSVGGLAITDEDIARVKEARQAVYLKDQAHAFIPYNSRNPELAKQFLLFFCSDFAGEIFSNVTHGFSPFYIKVNETNEGFMNGFDKEVEKVANNSEQRIGVWHKANFYYSRPAVENNFFNNSGANNTPEKLYANFKEINTKNGSWRSRLEQAGLALL